MEISTPHSDFDHYKHVIKLERIKELCFNLSNIFYAHQQIVREYEDCIVDYQEEHLEKITSSDSGVVLEVMRLHNEIAFTQISITILELAILFRVLDDQRNRENDERYIDKLKNIDPILIGYPSDAKRNHEYEKNPLRYYCNKIIHCENIIPVYKRKDTLAEIEIDIFEYSGEIEMKEENWHETLFIPNFVDGILSVL